MDLELTGKVAIVGGASKGLGRACAQVLAEEGAAVAVCSRSKPDLDKAAQEIRDATGRDVLAFPGDLDHPDTIRDLVTATIERFDRLDVLVNNSGGPPLARAHNATEEQWTTAVQRSLLFFARMCREALPHLKRSGSGRIVNILAATVYNPIPNLARSGVTRLGVRLEGIKEKRRGEPAMQTNVANLSDRDLRDIADWLAAQRPVRVAYQLDPAKVAMGKTKAEQLGCATCHLPTFYGADAIPRLAGQTPGYVRAQLEDFGAGKRRHGTGQRSAPATSLNDQEMDGLAQFLASLE